jgi:NADPH:quinone reductase-like Zn-dependent oxidoreductase
MIYHHRQFPAAREARIFRPMQACIYEQYGSAEVVTLGEVATPAVKADELLVRVHAASVTTADWRFRAAAFPTGFKLAGRLMLGLLRPRNRVLGMDFAGTVVATGKKVTRFQVGDRVFGATSPMRRGAHAEYLTVKQSAAVIHTPAALTDQQAAAIPFGGSSALAFVRDFGRVRPGQRVLVVGASGAVGSWAVQLARHLGAEVTGVCSAPNLELVRSLGAHRVVDYASGPIARAGDDYDLIFDTIGVTTFAGCQTALAGKGMYLPLNAGLREIGQALRTWRSRGRRVKYAVSSNTRAGLETLVQLIEAGAVRPVVDRVYPMAQIADAHRHVEGRHKRGSVVVTMGTAAA